MSVAHTTPAPVASGRRASLARWIGGGTLAATALTVLTIAVWPASEADKARADGEQFGQAVDGFVGERTADDGWDQDLYEAELDTAVDDLTSNADQFRSEGPEVQQAFWDGFDTGLNGS